MVVDDLGVGLAHRRFDHLGHGRLAVDALEMRNRHLAGSKSAQLHTALDIVEPLFDPRLQVGGRDDNAVFPLETRGGSFCHLHRHYSSRREIERIPAKFLKSRPAGAGGGARTPTTFVTGT